MLDWWCCGLNVDRHCPFLRVRLQWSILIHASVLENSRREGREITQGGAEETQDTLYPHLGLCSIPKTTCHHPIHIVTAKFDASWTSSQNLNESRERPSLDRWHRKFPHRLSLSMDERLYAVAMENTQPVEGRRNVQFNVLAFIKQP